MPDVAQLASEVFAKATQLHAAMQVRQDQAQLNHRRVALEQFLEKAATQHDFLVAWEGGGLPRWSDQGVLDARERARLRVKQARDGHQEDPTVLVEDRRFWSLRGPLETWLSETARALASAWAAYTTDALPPPLGGGEQLLRADPRTEPGLVDRLLLWDRQLRVLAEKTEPTADDLKQFRTTLQFRREAWSTVSIEADPEVIAFIRASGDQGAPLSLLTPKVKDWLERSHLTGDYVVRKSVTD